MFSGSSKNTKGNWDRQSLHLDRQMNDEDQPDSKGEKDHNRSGRRQLDEDNDHEDGQIQRRVFLSKNNFWDIEHPNFQSMKVKMEL